MIRYVYSRLKDKKLAPYIFPCVQILTCLGAAVMYGFAKDWRKVIYWLCAAAITAVYTF